MQIFFLQISISDSYIVLLISVIIWIFILSFIISSSTRQKEHIENERKQINLLSLIAEKLGVDPDKIDEITKEEPKQKNRFFRRSIQLIYSYHAIISFAKIP